MKHFLFHLCTLSLICAAWSLSALPACHADTLAYTVTIDTDALDAQGQGAQFSLDFSFADDGTTQGNAATGSGFSFGTGSGTDTASRTVNESTAFAPLLPFTPGNTLSFSLNLDSFGQVAGGTPDRFSFFIRDAGGAAITTTDTNVDPFTGQRANALFTIDYTTPASPEITRFAGTGVYDGVTVQVTPVPEPTTTALMLAGLGGIALKRRRKSQQSQA